jgi:CubicO group peptidase (beta-lactamase class C family)
VDAAAERITAAIEAYPGRADLSGVLRISRHGALLFERAYGMASVQLGVANRPDTRFHIASVTKMFISAAIVRLACEGRLSLQQHPAEYLAEAAVLDRRITLHQLLCHTAGVADAYEQPDLRVDMTRLAASGGRLLDYLVALPPTFEPGTRWRYSSTGFLLLGYILEAVVGEKFERVLQDAFFRPLALYDTGVDDPFVVNPGRATGQSRHDGVWHNTRNDELAECDAPRELYSTAADLDRWGIALARGDVLSESGMQMTFTPHAEITADTGFDPRLRYGYGWFLGSDFRWIGGITPGFRAQMWQFPAPQLNVVMLWNNDVVDSYRLFRALQPVLSS